MNVPPAIHHLWLHVEDGHLAGAMYAPYGVQLRPVHAVLVHTVLQVLVRLNVRQHHVVGDEEVVTAVHLVLARRPSGVLKTFK